MALWQVSFIALPIRYIASVPRLDEKRIVSILTYHEKALSSFSLPEDYRTQLTKVLPAAESWSPELELWGDTESDDFSIWRTNGRIRSIELRIDVRKLDDRLLSSLLDLANEWECTYVELEHQTVCNFSAVEFRRLLAGHSHTRALRDPDTWLPFLAERASGESAP